MLSRKHFVQWTLTLSSTLQESGRVREDNIIYHPNKNGSIQIRTVLRVKGDANPVGVRDKGRKPCFFGAQCMVSSNKDDSTNINKIRIRGQTFRG